MAPGGLISFVYGSFSSDKEEILIRYLQSIPGESRQKREANKQELIETLVVYNKRLDVEWR